MRKLTDEQLRNVILEILHRIPDSHNLWKMLTIDLKYQINEIDYIINRKRLAQESLIIEEEPENLNSKIKITPKGYEIFELYGSYTSYKKEWKKLKISENQIAYLKEKNIRLQNLNIIVGIISFILGILLSSPIKSILRQWLISDG